MKHLLQKLQKLLIHLPLVAGMCISGITYGQEAADSTAESAWSINADIASRYVWRGMKLSDSPVLQPSAEYAAGNFTFGAWGSHTFAKGESQEIDLYASYTFKNVTLTVTDYFAGPDSLAAGGYFQWEQDKTIHTVEATLTFDGPEAFPAQLLVGTLLYGYDLDEDGNNLYSTYIELNRTWEKGAMSYKPFIGMTPMTGYYSTDGAQLVNAGVEVSREIAVTEQFSLSLSLCLTANPHLKHAFFTAKISL